MADKEEVEPTEESAAAESSDAAANLEPADADPNEPAGGAAPASSGAHALNPGDPTPDDPTPDDPTPDDFDEIVRDSGIGEDRNEEPDPADDDRVAEPDSTDDDEKTLAPVGAGALATAESKGASARERSARKAKDVATKRRDQPVKVERTGPVKFVRESVGELRKVVYPTGQQLINYFIVVLVFVLFIIAYVSLLDLGLGALIFKIFS